MNPLDDFNIETTDRDDGPAALEIHRALGDHNADNFPPSNRKPLILSVSDESGLAAGLRGFTHWGWLYISHLWVRADRRGQRLGERLVRRAEIEAERRNCPRSYVDTFSPEAVRFYERLGFEVFGRLDEFPPGHTRWFLRKTIRRQ